VCVCAERDLVDYIEDPFEGRERERERERERDLVCVCAERDLVDYILCVCVQREI
jgi:hypothetical protein